MIACQRVFRQMKSLGLPDSESIDVTTELFKSRADFFDLNDRACPYYVDIEHERTVAE